MDVDRFNKFFNKIGNIANNESVFQMRRRLNPHHSAKDVAYETNLFNEQQQKQWQSIKQEFLENREEFVKQASPGQRSTLDAIQKVIDEEADSIIFGTNYAAD